MDRFYNPKVIEIANKMKEERDMLLQDRAASGQWQQQVLVGLGQLGIIV